MCQRFCGRFLVFYHGHTVDGGKSYKYEIDAETWL